MSKFFKGIAKVVKNIGKGLKKVFKKIIKSKVFKIVLIAVAVYFGGVALGLWGGGAAGAGGVVGSIAPTATTAVAPLATTASAPLATTATGLSTAAQTSAALTAAPAATTAGSLAATTGEISAAILGGGETVAAPSFLSTIGSGISSGAKAVGGFLQANPLLASTGLTALSSALSPDEMEIIQAQEDARKREFEAGLAARRENLTGFNTLPLLHQARGNVTSLRDRRIGGL